ncbi:hypothetical protein J7M00_08030 [bacterium]|nr:hypothetical protein [bacterium]
MKNFCFLNLLILLLLVPILVNATSGEEKIVFSVPMNVTVVWRGKIIEITPEKIVLAQGEVAHFDVYLALKDGKETPINDATVYGVIHRPDGEEDGLGFSFIGNGTYRSDDYTFMISGVYRIEIVISSPDLGEVKSYAEVNVMSGGIRSLFPVGFNITARPTLNFTLYPESFILLMKDKEEIINLTIQNNEKFNLIVLANTFLEALDGYKVIIPPDSNKTIRFVVKLPEYCAQKNWVIGLYIRGGLEVNTPINRVDVPVKAFTICPDGTFPKEALKLLEKEKAKIKKLEKEYWKTTELLTYLVIGLAGVCLIVYWKYENLRELLNKLRSALKLSE